MCTRIFWNRSSPFVVARTMDWPDSTFPQIFVLPRGLEHDGAIIGGEQITENGLVWTSRYGSVITTIYGVGTADGVNERGLAAHLLYLEDTDFGDRAVARPALGVHLWAQYLLDMAATVEEAVLLLGEVQLVMVEAHGHRASTHLAIEDASGDSAIIEVLGGVVSIHRDRRFTVLTNEPPYQEQLRILLEQDFSAPNDRSPLDGNVNPEARFQRASYFTDLLPHPSDERGAVAGVLAIARNVSIPFGAPYEGFGLYNTEYRTVVSLEARRYYFELTTAPNLFWLDLDRCDFTEGAPVRALNPDDVTLSGEVGEHLTDVARPF
ncbi:linear amide C-N hydrolase [Mycetocola tolaasinivorans]|uniref:Linear amide C-N hydrolase n=1 Tax=Mycetocola tolaasinivorans TaxID=76635 RepID=A0A3L7A942_9MICO|nr:linear amide C-N hydrolase [Mycetocola tolaasinivorans]RLP76859.1 linear amide C-N hydrolase [Mycetocola tolaasinivorans]